MNNNFYQIAAIAGLSAMAVVPAQMVYAQQVGTTTLTLVQGLGWGQDGSYYKAIVEDNQGKRFFVWYYNQLGAEIGSTVVLTYENWSGEYYWKKMTNQANGQETSVDHYLAIN
jgi:hypothetical protein